MIKNKLQLIPLAWCAVFQEQIRKHYDRLSPSYRKVADYLVADYQSAAFMTAAGLADAVDVDTTTVVRFAQRLGYPGFPELIGDVQQQVKSDLDRSYLSESVHDNALARIQERVMEDRNHLERALAYNTPDILETILDLLRTADRIVVIGESHAAPLAESFAGMLKAAGLPASSVGGDAYERATALVNLTNRALVVGLSPLMESSGVARALRFARAEGAMTLACTPSPASQAACSAEYLLNVPGETKGPVPSLVALYSLCTAIANTLGEERPDAFDRWDAEVGRAMKELS